MECPKCGYDRQPEDTHCALCGVDFGLLDRQAAEKKQLKAKKSTKSQGMDTGPILEMEAAETEKINDSIPLTGDCPKCGAPRNADALECPQCGVIYEKHEQMLAQKKAEEEEQKRAEEKRFLEEKARIQREAEEGIRREREKREAAAKKQALAKQRTDLGSEINDKINLSHHINTLIVRMKNNGRKISIAAITLVTVIAVGWGGSLLILDWQEKSRQEKLIEERNAEKRRFQEEQQKAIQGFYTNKEEHIQNLMSLITQRKFDEFAHEIKKYDTPQLKTELESVRKYLEEIKLFDSAKSIPASEFGKNYEVYLKLIQFDPKNKLYLNKLNDYRMKYAQQNYEKAANYLTKKKRVRSDLTDAIAAIDKAIQLEGEKKVYNKIRYDLKNAELLFYEGNKNLQMAVRNDGLTKGATGGQRKIYVWLKNVGDTPYFINVDYFTLVGKNNKRYSYNNCSRELIVNLQPGQETGGFLYFYTPSQPAELVFNHINAGKISRKFP
ncbi:MAG: hypothetical protein C4522_02680 [Desulfobacteraceae bacterium]|nr:MAG: hypothetical protein C4522_02680 [Desulfobacteraceae bacterium]